MALLQFCYTGEAVFIDCQTTVEIFQVAEEYLLNSLKASCERELVNKHIHEDTVLQLLQLAHMYSSSHLKVLLLLAVFIAVT